MLTAYRRVFANSRLARLMVGEFVSSVGDWLYLVAMLIVVYEQSHDPLALGLVGAARVAPYLILSVPAGIVADRFDRRLILLGPDGSRGRRQIVLRGRLLDRPGRDRRGLRLDLLRTGHRRVPPVTRRGRGRPRAREQCLGHARQP